MKVSVLVASGRPLEIEQVNISNSGPHEVLIRTAACGLCDSDLHFIEGRYPHLLPAIPGHEAASIVEAVGGMHRAGCDAAISCPSAFCGHCEYCVTGRMSLRLSGETWRKQGEAHRHFPLRGTAYE